MLLEPTTNMQLGGILKFPKAPIGASSDMWNTVHQFRTWCYDGKCVYCGPQVSPLNNPLAQVVQKQTLE